MRLVALLSARGPLPGGAAADDVRIGVHMPVEHQARQALAAGAEQIIIRIDQPNAGLVNAADALTRESGVPVLLLNDGPDLGRRIERDDRLLMLAERMIVPQDALDRLVAADVPALLVTPTETATVQFERIDGRCVWAGGALLAGDTLLSTIDMLGDWDLELTLLRRAVQQGAQRIELAPSLAEGGQLARVIAQEDAERALDALTQASAEDAAAPNVLSALLRPLKQKLVSFLGRSQVNPAHMHWAAGMISVLAIAVATAGWPLPALLLALLAVAAFDLGGACAHILLRRGPPSWMRVLVMGAGLATLAIIGGRLTDGGSLALMGVALPLLLVAVQIVSDASVTRPDLGRFGLWKRCSTAMALTIVLGGTLGGRVAESFLLLGLCAFGTVAARLLAAEDNRI